MKSYVINVQLRDSEPVVRRSFRIASDFILADLHEVLQIVMGWENKYPYVFVSGEKSWGTLQEGASKAVSAERVLLDELLVAVGDRLEYIYDDEDRWVHELELAGTERELPMHPLCLSGERNCPPERIGGIAAYQEIVSALKEKGTAEYRRALEKVGADFDPADFDLDFVNEVFREGASMEIEDDWGEDISEDLDWEDADDWDDILDDEEDDWDDD